MTKLLLCISISGIFNLFLSFSNLNQYPVIKEIKFTSNPQ